MIRYKKSYLYGYRKWWESCPNSTNQLILVQNKKNNSRLFSVDKHNVKLVHETTSHPYKDQYKEGVSKRSFLMSFWDTFFFNLIAMTCTVTFFSDVMHMNQI